ncbi:MAG: diguanylate cyclase [Gemmatimonadales bacterium]
MTRRLLLSLIPEGTVVLTAFAIVTWNPTVISLRALAQLLPFAVFGAGLLLSWRFHRGRALLSLVVLALAGWAASNTIADVPNSTQSGRVVFQATALLLPLNLTALAFLPERGPFTATGMLRLVMIGLEVGGVILLAYPEPAPAADLLQTAVFPPTLVAWSHVGDLALLASFTALAALTIRIAVSQGRRSGLLWALVAAMLAFHTTRGDTAVMILFAAAGLAMVVGVVETSYRMAYHDALTGLPARRALNEALDQVDGPYTVAMVDVDRFKQFNDEHGHDVGDQVLRMVGDRLKNVDGGGRPYRYGGEEFAILFPGKTRDYCQPHLEHVRYAIESASFAIRGSRRPRKKPAKGGGSRRVRKHLSVTVSIGLAERTDGRNTPDKVVRAADQALYRAKKSGRNRVSR